MNATRKNSSIWITFGLICALAVAWSGSALAQSAPATRTEKNSIGEKVIPNTAYYGVATAQAIENFPFNTRTLRNFPSLIVAHAYVKKAAALANAELGELDKEKAKFIAAACDEIIAGKLHDQFPVDMVQGGAGTSTNMNANEVIANRALELMGKQKGDYKFIHPNDDVNNSQSTNDVYPVSIKLAALLELKATLAAMENLKAALEAKAQENKTVLKMGRTEMQDAVPMTVGQEFHAWADTVADSIRQLKSVQPALLKSSMGATAIGTGINTHPQYAALVTKKLAEVTGMPWTLASDLVAATSEAGTYMETSGALKRSAIQISKICNDLRLLSSGPRAGFFEIVLPATQPGSSIMPGKVNPVIPEVFTQIAYQIAGYDTTITMAAEVGSLQLNMAEPIIAYDLLDGIGLLGRGCTVLTEKCIKGIVVNKDRLADMVKNSIGLVTALNPVLGYDKSSSVAKEALATGRSVYHLVLEKGWLNKAQLDDLLKPEKMTQPREVKK
ncbi:MAG: aspartate ammonia-lyase [Desulfovibrio sp.]|nr:aspartate ammonia-lyase [Desulfovibrio sp.]